jgi:pimeloyl-ACP methyl ester carboxylesterase
MSKNIKLPGITSRQVQSERINMHILTCGPPAGTAVLFIHGNGSSGGFWDETMLALPEGYYAIAPDLRGYGTTEPLPVDATLGLEDMVADIRSLVKSLGLGPFHIVGHSMGGGIVMKYAIAHADELLSITLVDSMSPYGFSGSKGVDGTPVHEDGAPAGAASVNPDFVRLLGEKEAGAENPMAPLNVMRQFYVKPPFVPEREEAFLEALLSTRVGDDWYPGNSVPSNNWPGAAPGDKGVVNGFSRKYFDASALTKIDPTPPILWIRGAEDLVVSDNSMWDIAALGAMGFVPGWPGADVCPPQPMLQQIRAVLDQYEANGGSYDEVVIEDAGHSPFIEKPEAFAEAFHSHLEANN